MRVYEYMTTEHMHSHASDWEVRFFSFPARPGKGKGSVFNFPHKPCVNYNCLQRSPADRRCLVYGTFMYRCSISLLRDSVHATLCSGAQGGTSQGTKTVTKASPSRTPALSGHLLHLHFPFHVATCHSIRIGGSSATKHEHMFCFEA